MGFGLSILYLVTSYLSPATLFGPLAAAHIELILGVLILSVSLPAMIRSFALKTPQSLALIGLAFAVILSVLIGMRWAGGGVQAFLVFMPNALAYFFVCLHCDSKKKLKALILMLLFVCFFVIARGGIDLLHGVSEDDPAISASTGSVDQDLWNSEHPYVFEMHSDSGDRIYRLRGLGLINDPNDFGQLIVCVIPLMFIFWRAKKIPQNLAFVILPVSALLFGLILTHSRGALVALMAVAVVAARRRIGTLPALMLAGGLFCAAMALHLTGGGGLVGVWGGCGFAGAGGERRHGPLGRKPATVQVSSVVRSGFWKPAGLSRSYLPQHGRSLRGRTGLIRIVLLVYVYVCNS